MNNGLTLLSTAEVAERAGTWPSTVTRWAKTGKLPAVFRGKGPRGGYLFDPADVEAFLASEGRTAPEK